MPAKKPTPVDDTQYRFVGSDTEVTHLRRFTQFGELVTIPGGAAEAATLGAPLIPDAAFQAAGFTDDELAQYSNAADHEYYDEVTHEMKSNVTPEFLAKKGKALLALHELQTAPPETAPTTHDNPAPSGTPEGVATT